MSLYVALKRRTSTALAGSLGSTARDVRRII
jgi:hypothetical protein